MGDLLSANELHSIEGMCLLASSQKVTLRSTSSGLELGEISIATCTNSSFMKCEPDSLHRVIILFFGSSLLSMGIQFQVQMEMPFPTINGHEMDRLLEYK